VIKRLRPTHSEETLADMYSAPYDSTKWDEHNHRVEWTIERLQLFLTLRQEITSIADLSCGDGRIIDGLETNASKTKSDISMKGGESIERMITKISADLLICSETLEHLDDPKWVLAAATKRFKWICITTPLGEDDPEKNYEHYWGWDLFGMSQILEQTLWAPRWVDTLNESYYTYQLWIARSTWA